MNPLELRSRLVGVVGFPVTPFHADGSVDLDGLGKNVDAMASHAFCSLVIAGGTGELYSLSVEEHRDILRASVEAVAGRMPIIAGVGGSIAVAREQAIQSWKAGAQGILALPPYYAGADDVGLLAYYQQIGAATPLGLLVYSRDWVNPGAAFVERLADAAPTLIAWKDGQGDARRYQFIMSHVGARLHWIGGAGDDLVPTYYRMGLRTYTSSISNVSPRMSLALHDLAVAGDEAKLQQLLRDFVVPLYAFRARRKGYEVTVMKVMMTLMGMPAGPVRPPLVEVTDSERTELAAMVDRWREWL
jgi:5-dehydro-4-deoxyglucarate dehydratase